MPLDPYLLRLACTLIVRNLWMPQIQVEQSEFPLLGGFKGEAVCHSVLADCEPLTTKEMGYQLGSKQDLYFNP